MLRKALLLLLLGVGAASSFGRREGVPDALHDFAGEPSAVDRVMQRLDSMYAAHRRKAIMWERKSAEACRHKVIDIATQIANPLVVVLAMV